MFEYIEGERVNYFRYNFNSDGSAAAFISGRSDGFNSDLEQRKILYEELNIDHEQIVQPGQIHSAKILEPNCGSVYDNERPIPADAVICQNNNCLPQGLFADCVPVFLYHSSSKIKAIVHSGWKGTTRAIISMVLERLKYDYLLPFSGLKIAIGPAIQQENYQVDSRVYELFWKRLPVFMRGYSEEIFVEGETSSEFYLDLKKANYLLAVNSGVPSENIFVSDICTYDCDRLYSYRREGEQAGRMTALLLTAKTFESRNE
ncbi:polyphenol oxidase family protein [Halarsenatibacter silvermanii]|uniref:Purine nucleoside phosphorylase n=1 Tax=Halarsenatibacter silvermanii TaxID=321763 RepID=A0A1G9JMF5_9FIRM|nr:polyphenol oxidase family protein [Halarsenatibacter silvermanii]SDL38482.1 conserved hypothetical protein [Halarsenatibacter silvermanii]